ncbi:MAG TPA: hypothetical protein VGG72_20045 [Bryobacteraceae bacterium]
MLLRNGCDLAFRVDDDHGVFPLQRQRGDDVSEFAGTGGCDDNTVGFAPIAEHLATFLIEPEPDASAEFRFGADQLSLKQVTC